MERPSLGFGLAITGILIELFQHEISVADSAHSGVHYFATCARGIEEVLAEELNHLAAADVQLGRGGVHFAGDKTLLFKANLWLRTAIRVLCPILEAAVTSPEEL